jgi:hypothetical protein
LHELVAPNDSQHGHLLIIISPGLSEPRLESDSSPSLFLAEAHLREPDQRLWSNAVDVTKHDGKISVFLTTLGNMSPITHDM